MKDTEHGTVLSSEALLEKLRDADWDKIIKQLHYYSLNRLKRFHQLADRYSLQTLSAEFADEAIRQLWMEERRWDVDKYPQLYDFLKGAVDSIRYNFLKKKEVCMTTFIDRVIEETFPHNDGDPEIQLEAKELEEQIKQIFNKDEEAYNVFDCLRNGIPPKDIAIELGVPINQVYNATKRIERKLLELRRQLK